MTALATTAPTTVALADDTTQQSAAERVADAVDAVAPAPVDAVRVPVQDNGDTPAPITASGADLKIAIPADNAGVVTLMTPSEGPASAFAVGLPGSTSSATALSVSMG